MLKEPLLTGRLFLFRDFEGFDLFGEGFHVLADFLVGYLGVYLGGSDTGVSQDAAEGLDGHALGKGEGGEGVAGDMEGKAGLDAALLCESYEVVVAAAVAGNAEDGVAARLAIAFQDSKRHVEEPYIGRGVGLAAARDYPSLSVEHLLDVGPA